jgi:hypothetical protein
LQQSDCQGGLRPTRYRVVDSRGMRTWTIRVIADSTEQFGEETVYSLGLAATPDEQDDRFALIFSRAEPDNDGSGYSLVAEPGQRTAYGAVTSCDLNERLLRFTLTESAATGLRLPAAFSLNLAVDDDQLVILERGLKRVGVQVSRPS